MFGVLGVTLGLLVWTRGPAVYDRAMLLYWQRQCMTYTAPADQVVYDNSPDGRQTLLARGGKPLGQTPTSGVGRVPGAAAEFLARTDFNWFYPSEGVLFLHGLTSPGGQRRLIMITVSEDDAPSVYLPNAITAYTIDPYGWSKTGGIGLREVRTGVVTKPANLQIYAGQVDPNDPSHFTIRFKRTEAGMIDGRLTDDGVVHLQFLGSKADGFDTPLESN